MRCTPGFALTTGVGEQVGAVFAVLSIAITCVCVALSPEVLAVGVPRERGIALL